MSESSAAGAVRNLDLLGIYCNDHLAAATGGIELVSRMLGQHRGTPYEPRLEELLDELREERAGAAARPWPRSACPIRQYKQVASWIGEKLSRGQAQRAPAVPLAAERPGRVRVHRHRRAGQAGRLRDPAGARRPSTPGWTPTLLDRLIAQADKQHDWLADVRREVAGRGVRRGPRGGRRGSGQLTRRSRHGR